MPRSKKSRWNLMIDSVTLMIVRCRCWMERMSHCAERSLSWMYSLAPFESSSAAR